MKTDAKTTIERATKLSVLEADGMSLEVNSTKGHEIQEVMNAYSDVALLTPLQRVVLFAMIDDILAENIRTQTDIAAELGIERKSIYTATRTPRFRNALALLTQDIIALKAPQLLIATLEAGKKDWRANKFLLEYAGMFVNTNKNVNINTNVTAMNAPRSPEQAVDAFLINLLAHGWSKIRIIERIDALIAEGI